MSFKISIISLSLSSSVSALAIIVVMDPIVNETSDSYKASLDLNLNGKFNSLKEFKNLKIAALEDTTKNIEKLSFSTSANNKIDLEFDKKGNLLNTSVKGKADITNLELDLLQNAYPNVLDDKNRKFKNGKFKAEFDKSNVSVNGIIFNQNDSLDLKINSDLNKKTSKINIITVLNISPLLPS